jgi:glycosyltransferase involved in cell wall biosynthesis
MDHFSALTDNSARIKAGRMVTGIVLSCTSKEFHVGLSITVVIPTYNGARYLAKALASVFAQTQQPEEIIIVDDASRDNTVEVVAALAAQSATPLRLIRLPCNSGGPAGPMNAGVAACRTPLVATLDQDDLMAPTRLAVQARILDRYPEAPAVIGLLSKIDSAEQRRRDGFVEESRRRILGIAHRESDDCVLLDPTAFYQHVLFEGTLTIASSTAFRVSAWHAIKGFSCQLRVAWDLDLSCKLARLGPVAFVDQVIGFYRLHAGNTSMQGLSCYREVVGLQGEHLRRPLLAINQVGLRKHVIQGCLGLGYHESVRGNVAGMFRAYAKAWRCGARTHTTLLSTAKGMLRAARAKLVAPRHVMQHA